MNDPAPPRWTEPASLPPPTIYDPADDEAPPFGSTSLPTVMLLLVGEAEHGWAARTAIELADSWAEPGWRVVLADFHLENPVLQEHLGGQGVDGVVDLFLYGVSPARCTRPVEGRNFQFIPTGTYTPDADAVFRHPRWPKLIAGYKQSRATQVIFAPASAADLGALGTWVDQVILLGQPRSPELIDPLVTAGAEIRGLIVSPRGESATPPPPPPEPAEAAIAPEPAPSEPRADYDEELHLPPPPAREP